MELSTSPIGDITAKQHWLTLLLFIAVVFVSRIPGLDEPLERDITSYAVIGHEILSGKNLYSDVWDHKPPAVYAVFAVFEFLFGYGQFSIYLLGAVFSALTLVGLYFCIYRYSRNWYLSIGAGLAWLILSIDIRIWANQPNVEVFLNALTVWILFFSLPLKSRPLSRQEYLAIGILLFFASLFKTVVLFLAIPLWLTIVYIEKRIYRCDNADMIKKTAIMAAAGLIGWAAIGGYFTAVGRFNDFYSAVFMYNIYYSDYKGGLLTNLGHGLLPKYLFPDALYAYIPLYLVIVAGIVVSMRKKYNLPVTYLVIANIIGAMFSIAVPGFFFKHYYQLWLPVLIAGSFISLDIFKHHISQQYLKTFNALSALLVIYLFAIILPVFSLPPLYWSGKKYGATFIDSKNVALQINQMLTASETFFEWGEESGLYFYSGRHIQTKDYIIGHYALNHDFSRSLEHQTLNDLTASPPDLFVVNLGMLPYDPEAKLYVLRGSPILDWFNKNYTVFPYTFKENKRYIAGALNGSDLYKRLAQKFSGKPKP